MLLLPWKQVDWGTLRLGQQRSITVTGTATMAERNQTARFTASVRVEDLDKQTATTAVNTAMDALITDLKIFGISEDDLRTQNISVYEFEKRDGPEILLPGPGREIPNGETYWQASNTITITLREVNQASALADLLFASGATDVNGPSFHVDDTTTADAELLVKAVENARKKAEELAAAGNASLGDVLTIQEGYTSAPIPIFRAEAFDSAVSAPLEPGTSTLSKTVTVTFSLQ